MQKWIAHYHGRAVGVGDTPAGAVGYALEVITKK